MRIDGTSKPTGAYRAGPARSGATSAFSPEVESAPSAPAEVVPMAPASSLDALLALQAVDDPLQKRKKAVRRGQAVLDTLDEVKADLLVGRVGEGKLNQLLSLIGQAREQTQPGLDAVLDDIELRARVELAKFERFAKP